MRFINKNNIFEEKLGIYVIIIFIITEKGEIETYEKNKFITSVGT